MIRMGRHYLKDIGGQGTPQQSTRPPSPPPGSLRATSFSCVSGGLFVVVHTPTSTFLHSSSRNNANPASKSVQAAASPPRSPTTTSGLQSTSPPPPQLSAT